MAQEMINGVVYDVVRVQNPGSGGGGTFDGNVTIEDGNDRTFGTKADAPAVNLTAANTAMALSKANTIAVTELVNRGDSFGGRVQFAKRPGTNRSKLVTNVSSELIPANSNSWYMKNDSSAVIYYNFGSAASATPGDTDGSMRLDPGEFISSRDIVDTAAINVVVASGTAQIKARST